jgi:hypothetical protein
MTTSNPDRIDGIRGDKADLVRRLERLRWTAFPTERPALTPKQVSLPSTFGRTIKTANGLAKDFPYRLTRLKSADLVKRKLFVETFYSETGMSPILTVDQV